MSDALLVAALLAIAFAAGYEALFGTAQIAAERLAGLRGARVEEAQAGFAPDAGRLGRVRRRLPLFDASARRYAGRLAAAGFLKPDACARFALIRLGSAGLALIVVAVAGVTYQWGKLGLLYGAGGGAAIGAWLPVRLLGARIKRRRLKIAHELAGILELVAVCVEAGLALREAIKLVGEQSAEQGYAIGTEMRLIAAELATGVNAGQALRSAAERIGLQELRQVAATILQSEQLGAQVARALRASADMIRRERQLAAEAAAQKIALKIFAPLVLLILPAMLIVLLAPALIQALRTFGS